MSGEEDNFDIDIYGDGGGGGGEDYQEEGQTVDTGEQQTEVAEPKAEPDAAAERNSEAPRSEPDHASRGTPSGELHQIGGTDKSAQKTIQAPKHAPQAQGLKRKEGSDDRPLDPGATAALFLSELYWWITDDDVRGWANQCECEDELQEITFSEHKVNGKSKGQAYALFASPQAATAVKRKVDSFSEGHVYKQKFTITFSNPFLNPFKTLPKDGNNRGNNQMNRGYNNSNNQGTAGYNAGGGFRGGRGGPYNNRGGMNPMGGYARGGYQQAPQQPMPSGYQTPGYPGGNAMPQPYGGFQGRGGYQGGGGGMRGGNMGMRGGRGGMNGGMMGMPMGMNPAMPVQIPMGMPQMNAGMGMQGFPNPGFYPQQQDANWNPHGAKRTRQE